MKKLELFYNEKIKITRQFSELSKEEKEYMSNTFSFALFNLSISINELLTAIKKVFNYR